MTWSILARDPATGHLGIAVASRFFAVGAVVPHLRGGVGAVATQAFVNPTYGPDGLRMLAEGQTPETILRHLTARDDGHPQRQVHLIGMTGGLPPLPGRIASIGRGIWWLTMSRSPATCWKGRRSWPTRDNPHGMIDRRVIDDGIAALEAARIARGQPTRSRMTLKG